MGSVEKRFYGVASAMVSTMRLLGQMLSMGLALMVFALFIGSVRITPVQYPALLKSIQTIFMICTALCFVGIFASVAQGKKKPITGSCPPFQSAPPLLNFPRKRYDSSKRIHDPPEQGGKEKIG